MYTAKRIAYSALASSSIAPASIIGQSDPLQYPLLLDDAGSGQQ
jgi:hypothetical protein